MTIDKTRSKRAIRSDVGESDIPRLREDLKRIGDSIMDCQDLAYSLSLDKTYDRASAISHARFIELFEKGCKVPMTVENLTFHAEIRGRMSERLRLTMELQSVKNQISIFEKLRLGIENTLARIMEKGKNSDDN